MRVYFKRDLRRKQKLYYSAIDNVNEYVLRAGETAVVHDIYVNNGKYYRIENYKFEFLSEIRNLPYKMSFDIVECLGPVPEDRIIILRDVSNCHYALGYEEWEFEKIGDGGRWHHKITKINGPLTEELYSQVRQPKYKYQEYLKSFNERWGKIEYIMTLRTETSDVKCGMRRVNKEDILALQGGNL
jgi:hypothetical protein